MLKNIIGLLSGLLFGVGLILSGMTNPAKVIGFLDITGNWDISLALVMGGAISVAVFGFWWARRRIAAGKASLSGQAIDIPSKTEITPQLLGGAVLFGLGWGLAGICPGPGIVMAGSGVWQGIVFVIAMLVGMLGYQLSQKNN